jgi:hypothetical protein
VAGCRVAPDGRAVVAWQNDRDDPDPLWTGTADGGAGTNPDGWQIMIVARNATGAWLAPAKLGAADLANRYPDAQFSSTGDLVVAWESKGLRSSGAKLSVRAAVSADGGATFSLPSSSLRTRRP